MKLYIVVLVIILFISCDEKEVVPIPENLLSEDVYIPLLVEMQLLDSYAFTTNDSTGIDSLKEELFKYYNTTEESFINSNSYYQSKVEEHTARIDSALSAIQREQERIGQTEDDNLD